MRSLLRIGIFVAAVCGLYTHDRAASKDPDLASRNLPSIPMNARAPEEQPSTCVRTCLDETLNQYNCTAEQSCYCAHSKLSTAIEKCLSSTCELPDYLAGRRSYADTCDLPVRDKRSSTRKLCWSMFAIATTFIAGRVFSRMRCLGGSGFGWDDWIALLAYILLVPTDATSELEVRNGFGMDMYRLSLKQVVVLMKSFYFGEVLYSAIIVLTKISLVLLYLRIWPADSVTRSFRRNCWMLVAALTAFLIAGTLSLALQCNPINFVWLQVTGIEGSCINMEALIYAHGVLNVCFDVIVILLPVHVLLGMKLPHSKKAGLSAVFLVGFLVTICSLIRLQYAHLVVSSKNLTWDLHPIGVWSLIEANFSVVVCCMPALTGLIQRTWKKLFGTPPQMGYSVVSGDDAFSEISHHRSAQRSSNPEMVLEQWEGDARRNLEAEGAVDITK